MSKMGRPVKQVNWHRMATLAARGLTNDELIAASGVSRGTFYSGLKLHGRREVLDQARAYAEHVAKVFDMAFVLGMKGKSDKAAIAIRRLVGGD